MQRRSIFIGFSDASIATWKLLDHEIGAVFATPASFDREPIRRFVFGEVVAVYNDVGGKMLILRNMRRGHINYHCSGWDYIPIWLGTNGQNGVLAHWKDPIASTRCVSARQVALAACEDEVSRAMAL